MKNLKEKIEKIDELIEKRYGNQCVPDGIVDIEKYLNSKFKILWILKEPHSKSGNDWDMRDMLKDAKKNEDGSYYLNPDMSNTFTNIIYSSYGILNNFMLWDEMDYISKNPDMIDVLQDIALININKLPAGASSNDNEIANAFEKYKDIISLQIETFKPDIIIGGNTIYQYMSEYFGLERLKMIKKIKFLEYYPTDKRVLIDAWHPAVFGKKDLTQEKYCDGIINATKDWANNYKK